MVAVYTGNQINDKLIILHTQTASVMPIFNRKPFVATKTN